MRKNLVKKKEVKIYDKADKVYRNIELPVWRMALLSVVLGLAVGAATILFRYLIAVIYNISFFGRLSFLYKPEDNTPPSPWGIFIIFVPVVGAALLVWLITTFVKNSDGHGVPEVISRIYHAKEKKKKIGGIIMGFSAALSIGTGGSTGNESPYIQVGASLAEGISEHVALSKKQRNILIAAAASAGLATCLNAPLTGIVFAIELILVTINITSLFPVAICTVTAIYIYRLVFGGAPAFFLSDFSNVEFSVIPVHGLLLFALFGIATGFLSVLYIKTYKYIERFFHGIKNKYLRHMSGMFIIGIIFYVMITYTGRYYVDGLGEYAVLDVLSDNLLSPWFLLLLVLLKIFATSVTVGSGSSGGVFTPLLFIGAVFGSFCCQLINILVPGLNIKPLVFVMAGMAGIISSTIGAFLTGIIAVFEMFGNVHYVVPVIITASVAFAIRKMMKTENVYAMSLKEKGLIVPEGLQAAIIPAINAHNIMSDSFSIMTLDKAYEHSADKNRVLDKHFFVITQNGRILGVVRSPIVKEESIDKFRENISQNVMLFTIGTSFLEISNTMLNNEIEYAIISKRARIDKPYSVQGIITRSEIEKLTLQEYNWLN